MSWEVRTMKSATSSSRPGRFYPALGKKNMARFWPLWAVFGVFWLFIMPLTLLTQDPESTIHYFGSFSLSGPAYFAQITILDLLSTAGVFSTLIFGTLAAMAVFSYLYTIAGKGAFAARRADVAGERRERLLRQFDEAATELLFLGLTAEELAHRVTGAKEGAK